MLETLASHCSIARTIQGCAIHHGGSLFDVTIHTRDHRAGWTRSVLNRFTSIDCSSSSWEGMLEEPTLRVQSSTIEKELKITGGPNQAEIALRYTLKDFLCARYQRRLFLISPHNREITIFFFSFCPRDYNRDYGYQQPTLKTTGPEWEKDTGTLPGLRPESTDALWMHGNSLLDPSRCLSHSSMPCWVVPLAHITY